MRKKFTSAFNLIVLNTTNLANSSQGQTSLKDTIVSPDIWGKTFTDWFKKCVSCVDCYMF